MPEGRILIAALSYAAKGFSVIPIPLGSKLPAIAWKQYQQERATEQLIREWWTRWPDSNVGIVTGAVSNLVVLDIDDPQGWDICEMNGGLPPTAVALTSLHESGWRKRHYYFVHPGCRIKNSVKKLPGLDVRGDGGYVLAPPSLHPSGVRYEWMKGVL